MSDSNTPTVYITIGNSDNKLTQHLWSQLYQEIYDLAESYSFVIYGVWASESTSQYQNGCVCFGTYEEDLDDIRDDLRELARKYNQDAISLAIATPEMINSNGKE